MLACLLIMLHELLLLLLNLFFNRRLGLLHLLLHFANILGVLCANFALSNHLVGISSLCGNSCHFVLLVIHRNLLRLQLFLIECLDTIHGAFRAGAQLIKGTILSLLLLQLFLELLFFLRSYSFLSLCQLLNGILPLGFGIINNLLHMLLLFPLELFNLLHFGEVRFVFVCSSLFQHTLFVICTLCLDAMFTHLHILVCSPLVLHFLHIMMHIR
mmetsp:Transcript_5667/g.21360  ORF Transcript_5667/g.21360 Transcript_5667/m.21360 type:complete len:214 (+) Transcript_5667:5666-6307(+)